MRCAAETEIIAVPVCAFVICIGEGTLCSIVFREVPMLRQIEAIRSSSQRGGVEGYFKSELKISQFLQICIFNLWQASLVQSQRVPHKYQHM